MAKLKHHLHASKLHYMPKAEAEEMAEAHEWETHDTDEEDVPDPPPGLTLRSDRSGASLAYRRSRSRSLGTSPDRGGSRRRSQPRNLLAIGAPILSSRSDSDRRCETEYRRVIVSIEAALRAARHAQRLSLSAADAFGDEAATLERSLEEMMRTL